MVHQQYKCRYVVGRPARRSSFRCSIYERSPCQSMILTTHWLRQHKTHPSLLAITVCLEVVRALVASKVIAVHALQRGLCSGFTWTVHESMSHLIKKRATRCSLDELRRCMPALSPGVQHLDRGNDCGEKKAYLKLFPVVEGFYIILRSSVL